jgi:hypothetical protein
MLTNEWKEFVCLVGKKLTSERVMDLKKDLHLWEVLVKIQPRAVDYVRYGGLRNPGKGFGE